MEPFNKQLEQKAKEVKSKGSDLNKRLSQCEKNLKKAKNKGQNNLIEVWHQGVFLILIKAMAAYNKQRESVEQQKVSLLEDVLLMERKRFVLLIESFCTPMQVISLVIFSNLYSV